MAFDRTTEEIAHFIGLLQLEVEASRLRIEYDAFSVSAEKRELALAEAPELSVSAPYTLKGFTPGLKHHPAPPEILPLPWLPIVFLQVQAGHTTHLNLPPVTQALVPLPATMYDVATTFLFPQLLPNSIVVYISQSAELADNDLFLINGSTPFVAPGLLLAGLDALSEFARDQLAPGHDAEAHGLVPRAPQMESLATAIADYQPANGPLETQLLLRGEEAQGIHVNGATLPADGDEETGLPAFAELLPGFLATDDTEGEDPDPFIMPAKLTLEPPFPMLAVDPGHTVVTGANTVINEVIISQAWVDAPVIAVAGDAIRLDVVSQVILREEGSPSLLPAGSLLPSQAINAVAMNTTSAGAPFLNPDAAGTFPQHWSVTRIDGDLIVANYVWQYSFITDFDRVEVSISAAATYISTGENLVVNATALRELGLHYDLIMVGGNMVTLNEIHQSTVLVDIDVVHGVPPEGVKITAGDNLQYNHAEITTVGHDEMVAMEAPFEAALARMAEGAHDIPAELARDARFEGKDVLKVLQVEGDLIKSNIIKQHNVLGDSDQIGLLLESLTALGENVEVITGSNAQLNTARIMDFGLDSEVLVAGQAYSDALIHQAQLIDPEAPPTGVGLSPLAFEAVAFLVDDSVAMPQTIDPVAPPSLSEHSGAHDGLQSILA